MCFVEFCRIDFLAQHINGRTEYWVLSVWNRSIFHINSRTVRLNSTRATTNQARDCSTAIFVKIASRKCGVDTVAIRTAEPSNKSQMAAGDPLAQFHSVSLHPPASLHPAASCVTSPATLNHPRLCRDHPFCTGNAPTLAEVLPPPCRGGKEVGGKTAVSRPSRRSPFSSGASFFALPLLQSSLSWYFHYLTLHANA